MKIKKILLGLFSLVIFANAEHQEFRIEPIKVYAKNNYTMECPRVITGYMTRATNINYVTGITTCKVYKYDPVTKKYDTTQPMPTQVTNFNPNVAKINTIPSNKTAIDRASDAFYNKQKNAGYIKTIQSKKDEFLKDINYVGQDKYLTTSKMLVAGTTLDGEIINIPKTVNDGEVVLQNGFTGQLRMGGSVITDISYMDEFLNTLIGIIGTESDIQERRVSNAKEALENTLSPKQVVSNVTSMVLDFYSSMNDEYQDLAFFALVLPIAFTIFFALLNKTTRKFASLNSQEDFYERIFLGVIVLFIFSFNSTTYDVSKDKKIDQNYFNNFSRWFIYKGVDWADGMTRAYADSYLSYTMKSVGLYSKNQYRGILYDKANNIQQTRAYNATLSKCNTYYDINKYKSEQSKGTTTENYPAGVTDDFNYIYTKYKNDRNNYSKIPTWEACSTAERKITILAQENVRIETKRVNFLNATKDSAMINKLSVTTEVISKSTADNGFLSAPLIASAPILFKASETIKASQKDDDVGKDQEPITNVDGNAVDTDDHKSFVQDLLNSSVYLMLPGADSIRGTLYSLNDDILKGIVFLENPTFNGALSALATDSKLLQSSIVTISVMKQIVDYLPVITLIVASLLTITFYYISIQIFFLVTPFMVVYAFGSNQPQIISNMLMRFFALAIKPIIFVITTVIALLVINMFDNIYNSMIAPIFYMFDAVSEADGGGLFHALANPLDTITAGKHEVFVGMIGALTLMISKLFAIGAIYYIVFHGQDIVMGLFGFKERGIDVQEGIGNQMSNDMQKYGKPI